MVSQRKISSIVSPNGEWEVEFERQQDRFAHRILWRPGKTAAPWVLASVEGADTDNWPPSPPLQQLSIEEQAGRPIALLVGMAGKSHWSMSVEPTDQGMLFDVACRQGVETGKLGSSYLLTPPSTADERPPLCTAADDPACTIHTVENRLVITPPDAGKLARWKYLLQAPR
ncbi:hypothetical protein [Lignipirellula cremea]|uniref:hypothetical protein n=1 Tax=Lignipirellula cremea TaxID=2528010 RepID=UPI0011A5C45A|nr:hypothetical protein [Lignipirellula cremea]